MCDLTLQWCRDNLQANGYETREDNVAVEFVVAKCSNGSDAIVAFNKSRPSQKDKPRVFVGNFFVEFIEDCEDLRRLVVAMGFGDKKPWRRDPYNIPLELFTPKCDVDR